MPMAWKFLSKKETSIKHYVKTLLGSALPESVARFIKRQQNQLQVMDRQNLKLVFNEITRERASLKLVVLFR